MEFESKVIENFIKLVKQSPVATEKFINHCIGVYEILKKDGESEEVCKSGLYHSIYGSPYFNDTAQTKENDRETIKKEIGEYSEKLVYEMCSLKNKDYDIVTGNFNWDPQILVDIIKICKANLIKLNSEHSLFYVNLYELILNSLKGGINPFLESPVKDDIKIIDNLFSYQFLSFLYTYTLNSPYTPGHLSKVNSKDSDFTSRFSCHLSRDEFFKTGLIPYIKKIATELGQDLFLKEYYLNHYHKSTTSYGHIDSHFENHITILIYPNLEWENLWGGDIKFYNEDSFFNSLVDFKPGRVIVFDSKIRHQVMPLSSLAKTDRFSIAIKACNFLGISNYSTDIIHKIIHVPCS